MKYLLPVLLLASTNAHSFGPYPIELIRVIDGDTVKVRAEIWPGLSKVINVRIIGIDAPESRRGKKNGVAIPECEIVLGKKAKVFTEQFLTGALILYDVKLGKFAGRVLGNIMTDNGDLSVNLILSGNAKAYKGEKRKVWDCQKLNQKRKDNEI